MTAAHRERDIPEPGERFVRDTMFRIRRRGVHPLTRPEKAAETRTVWGFAAVGSCLALLFLYYSYTADLSGMQDQFAQPFVDDSPSILLAETFSAL